MLAHRQRRWSNFNPTLGQQVSCWLDSYSKILGLNAMTDRQTDIYFIDRKKVNPDLFVIEIRERYVHVYTTLLIC